MIDSYAFGHITVNGSTYNSDLIIYPDTIHSPWWRKQGHKLMLEDLSQVWKYNPDILIIGTGYMGAMQVSPGVKEHAQKTGIELIIEKTGKAVKIYNDLALSKKAIAALHLTC